MGKKWIRTIIVILSTVILGIGTKDHVICAQNDQNAGAAIYYAGGSNGSDTNAGTDKDAPFATLGKALREISTFKSGFFTIYVVGDTVENGELSVGSNDARVNVTIKSIGASNAVIRRGSNYSGRMFYIPAGATLTLGGVEFYGADQKLEINGGKDLLLTDSMIYNEGTLNIYNGVTLKNNRGGHLSSFGGAVYNKGSLVITGGVITGNQSNMGGAIYNDTGKLYLYGGSINQNEASTSGGAIFNKDGILAIYGTTITENKAVSYGGGITNYGGSLTISGTVESNKFNGISTPVNSSGNRTVIGANTSEVGAGIFNAGTMVMEGGNIQNNKADSKGGAIMNTGILTMSGGLISRNEIGNMNSVTTSCGGGIYNEGSLSLIGGTMEVNKARRGGAIYSMMSLTLSGTASIPSGYGSEYANDIFMGEPLIIGADWTDSKTISISTDFYGEDKKIVVLQKKNTKPISQWINLKDAPYGYYLKEDGTLAFDASKNLKICYVDARYGNDKSGLGSMSSPYQTIQKAVSAIETSYIKGYIYLQSDITIHTPLIIRKDISIFTDPILNDGTESEIKCSDDFQPLTITEESNGTLEKININAMICNLGTLSLFNLDKSDTKIPAISLNGAGKCETIILNDGLLMMYNNSQLKGCKSAAVKNNRTFHMNGGSISKNYGYGVYNDGLFLMDGKGRITNNKNTGVYNNAIFRLTDGEISFNSSEDTGGIANHGVFEMSGGIISDNDGKLCGGIYIDKDKEGRLSGGTIKENVSSRTFGKGIYCDAGAKLHLSGDIMVEQKNDICLVYDPVNLKSFGIIMDGKLKDTNSTFLITRKIVKDNQLIDDTTAGDQLLYHGSNYGFTKEDAMKFLCATTDRKQNLYYCVNEYGKLICNIENFTVAVKADKIYYDGNPKSVSSVKVTNGDIELHQYVNYQVRYENNIKAGDKAKMIIEGINNYTGMQTLYFTIYPVN